MTARQRPGGGHQGAAGDRGRPSSEGTAAVRLDDPDVLRVAHQAVSRFLRVAHRLHGPLPALGTPAWMTAEWVTVAGTLAVLGEAWLRREDDLDRAVTERLKAASVAISEGGRWVGHGPSHADLERRRAELGPLARTVDAAAAARWAATGSSLKRAG